MVRREARPTRIVQRHLDPASRIVAMCSQWNVRNCDATLDARTTLMDARKAIKPGVIRGARPRTKLFRTLRGEYGSPLHWTPSWGPLYRRTEPALHRPGLSVVRSRRGLRPPKGLTPIGTGADDRRTEPPPTTKARRGPSDRRTITGGRASRRAATSSGSDGASPSPARWPRFFWGGRSSC